ncbi:MAG: putative LPS assembly protein LptD, partial [candidate division Zixibacteria bacterium]|nr:putative LPS assembly protein LptD [candidate division Zixibacteria bacterium]
LYDLVDSLAFAWGERVELWSFDDSVYAVGPYAVVDRRSDDFFMNQRPLLYLKYPDSSTMVEVLADSVVYLGDSSLATAVGDVVISSSEFSSTSGFARMHGEGDSLTLREFPTAERGGSKLSGGLITVGYEDDLIRKIVVVDSAHGDFTEAVDSGGLFTDRSVLSGGRIEMDFAKGMLSRITCTEQAYSWYYPSSRGGTEFNENSVSGDTIRFRVDNERLLAVDVKGGAIGTFVNGRLVPGDTVVITSADTVDYDARYIEYNLVDSTISLHDGSHVTSGPVALAAQRILFDTRGSIIEAFSAALEPEVEDSSESSEDKPRLQPNELPVELKDGDQVMHGNYLEYSLQTKKGRIVKSKSAYDKGFYYGDKLFREQEDIFYIEEGIYTTCDLEDPHFHFRSSDLKLIEGDKLIARPVVFYLGQVPLLAIPYYVFPLERGRHSGFLPFTFGNFERGVRYVRDIGYYCAASEYWDWRGSVDYYDNRDTWTINSRLRFAKRYVIENTHITGSFTRENQYNSLTTTEGRRDRWAIKGAYNHNILPSLALKAFGEYQSDNTYFTDYSPNLDEQLNRSLKSQATLSKKFDNGVSATATVSHTENLDFATRRDQLPAASVSLPTIFVFGNGSRDADGQLQQKWYHSFAFRYSPSLLNFSSRKTDTTVYESYYLDNDTVVTTETKRAFRSRKKYVSVTHKPSLTLPRIKLGPYVNIVPGFGYSETWVRIIRTDQSDSAGVEPGTYRTYTWNAGVSASTKLYGTIHPNIGGLLGLRHVITPSITYGYRPEVDRHPEIRRYAAGVSSTKSSSLAVSLSQDFQAKVKSGDAERSLNLLNLKTGFGYNFEADEKPLSNLITSFQSTAVPNLSVSGGITHSFYDPDTDELEFWSPFRQSFNVRTSLNLKGVFPFFDDVSTVPQGADSASQLGDQSVGSAGGGGKGSWACKLDYSYSESGRGAGWSKTSSFFVQTTINFNLTPTTRVTYTQRYDFLRSKTISNRVNIVKKLHCWSGSLYWVPVGPNRGFGFKLFVTEMPEIKIDNGHDSFTSGLQSFR